MTFTHRPHSTIMMKFNLGCSNRTNIQVGNVRRFVRRKFYRDIIKANIKFMGGSKTFLMTFNHSPFGADSQLIDQQNHARQTLRYAAANYSLALYRTTPRIQYGKNVISSLQSA